uniref:Uncharacterized protein n=1 Tax=Anguilla anguilla TaxID=7936 RepID=A0A0E9XU97_ANGAN
MVHVDTQSNQIKNFIFDLKSLKSVTVEKIENSTNRDTKNIIPRELNKTK